MKKEIDKDLEWLAGECLRNDGFLNVEGICTGVVTECKYFKDLENKCFYKKGEFKQEYTAPKIGCNGDYRNCKCTSGFYET